MPTERKNSLVDAHRFSSNNVNGKIKIQNLAN